MNDPADIAWCTALGVDAITTDHPERLWQEPDGSSLATVDTLDGRVVAG